MSTENQNTTQQTPLSSSDEIDLIQLAKTFWAGRRTLFKTMVVFIAIGLMVALLSPKEFTSSTTMVPQLSDGKSKLGGLSGLASMAGINLNMGGTSDIPPTIYPQIIASVPFQLELMKTGLTFQKFDQPVSLYDYYAEYEKPNVLIKYTLGLPGLILKAIRGEPGESVAADPDGPIRLTLGQKEVQKKLAQLLSINFNDKDGYVTLTSSMPEALPAAQLAQRAQALLQQYITEFKIQKASANLEFVQQRHDEVQKQYNQAQEELARFRDRNKNVSTAMALTELERINNNYTLIYNVYSELAKQLEQAKIQVKEDTPVFTIIEPVSVPLEKSKPKRAMILIIWAFLGGIVGTGVIFGKQYITSIKHQWNSEPASDV